MAVRFSLYCLSETTRDYLAGVINFSPQRIVSHTSLLSEPFPEQLNHDADVCFVEYDEQVSGLDLWIEEIQHLHQQAIYLYLREASTDSLLKALRLGARECFVSQISEDDFQKAIQRLFKIKTAPNAQEKTQIISLLGCKGGAGVTFIAVNLAQSLVSSLKEQVLLIDLDLRAGNISSVLDIQSQYSILDLIENIDRIDNQYLKDIIHSRESGLDVLPAPPRLEDSELVQAQHIEQILGYIRSENLYPWVLADLGDHLDEITLKAIEQSDLILLITLLTIPGLRAAKKIMEMFQLLEIGEEKLHLVANCHHKEADIKLAEAKKFLGQEFLAVLRYDHDAVVRSINDGRPLVDTQPRHRLSLDFGALVKELRQNGDDNGQNPGRWGSWKRLLRFGGKS
jgi:pilus assembly protein CpaE